MKFIKRIIFLSWFFALDALAKLPSYAQGGDLNSQLESKGQTITDTITLVAAIVGIIAIATGGVFFGAGNSDKGKSFIVGGLIGITVAGTVYGIAALVG